MEHNFENACMDNEPIFLDKLFKDECDHSGERTLFFIENQRGKTYKIV